MRLKISAPDDALYFRLDEAAIVESEEVQPGIILDYNAEGKVIGIEMLSLSEWPRNACACCNLRPHRDG
jgi:uncharacterized protein YuzE